MKKLPTSKNIEPSFRVDNGPEGIKARRVYAGMLAAGLAVAIGAGFIHQDGTNDTARGERQELRQDLEFGDFLGASLESNTVDSMEQVNVLREKFGEDGQDAVRLLDSRIHSQITREGDSIIPDESSPLVERESVELKEPTVIYAGEVNYNGSYSIQTLEGVDVDGNEIWSEPKHTSGEFTANNPELTIAEITEGSDSSRSDAPLFVLTAGTGLRVDGDMDEQVVRVTLSTQDVVKAASGKASDTEPQHITFNDEDIKTGPSLTASDLRGSAEHMLEQLIGDETHEGVLSGRLVRATAVDGGVNTEDSVSKQVAEAGSVQIGELSDGRAVVISGAQIALDN